MQSRHFHVPKYNRGIKRSEVQTFRRPAVSSPNEFVPKTLEKLTAGCSLKNSVSGFDCHRLFTLPTTMHRGVRNLEDGVFLHERNVSSPNGIFFTTHLFSTHSQCSGPIRTFAPLCNVAPHFDRAHHAVTNTSVVRQPAVSLSDQYRFPAIPDSSVWCSLSTFRRAARSRQNPVRRVQDLCN